MTPLCAGLQTPTAAVRGSPDPARSPTAGLPNGKPFVSVGSLAVRQNLDVHRRIRPTHPDDPSRLTPVDKPGFEI